MPPAVADWLMNGGDGDDEANEDRQTVLDGESRQQPRSGRPFCSNVGDGDLRSIFRPFNMHRMENVSILFAGNHLLPFRSILKIFHFKSL